MHGTSGPAATDNTPADTRERAMAEHQETMRQFLQTQERLMLAYLGTPAEQRPARPFSTPRSDKMTEMKCMQEDWRRGMEAALVKCLRSAVDMLPTTLRPLSTTAIEVKPSLDIRVRASARGASALAQTLARVHVPSSPGEE